MSFPVYIRFGSVALHPHWVFELLAYSVAFRLYLAMRRRQGDKLNDVNRWWVIAAAAMGAVVGSKFLYWFENPRLTLQHCTDPAFLLGGKTIVGALIGGVVAVELTKESKSELPFVRATYLLSRYVWGLRLVESAVF